MAKKYDAGEPAEDCVRIAVRAAAINFPDVLMVAGLYQVKPDLPFVPGVQTASDLIACVTRGYDLVKFFPAVPAGGLAALSALGGPFPNVRFCPTGGIGEADAAQWLAHPKVVAVGGSWVAPASDIKAGAWSKIEARARAAAALKRSGVITRMD